MMLHMCMFVLTLPLKGKVKHNLHNLYNLRRPGSRMITVMSLYLNILYQNIFSELHVPTCLANLT